jgi:glycosyltransferase involved in cell wall biosynthesis
MSKKKVIILGKLPPPYIGPSVATQIILNSDLKNRFGLIHLDTKINDDLSTFGRISLKKIVRNFVLYRRLAKLIKVHRPDLVLVPISQTRRGFLKDSVFIQIAAKHKVRVLVHLRGSEFRNWYNSEKSSIQKRVKDTFAKCAGVIVLGHKLTGIFEGLFPKENIYVVPNGGNYSFPSKAKSDKVRLLFFSNLLVAKGVSDVLRAVEISDKNGLKNFHLDLVGAWHKEEDKQECETILKRSLLPVQIHSPKSGEQKLKFFADADVFVFPPREPEGHPWSIVEAMAAALPVISTDKGAITESVKDGVNGFIVSPGQPEELAEKIKLLVTDEALRKKMGEQGRNIYLENFTEEKMVKNLEEVFNKVIEQ